MSRLYIHQVHIADGFVDDCDELIQRCSQMETLNYHTFCDIWKSMNFSSMYQSRTSHAEIAEMSEEVLLIAKHYMVANTSNFEESVAGLFLVYGLVNLQPYSGFAALRIVPEDVPAINRIELVARRERRYDVLYVLASLLIKGPTQYHAAQRERGMEPAFKKYLNGCVSLNPQGIRPKGVFFRQNKELDVIRELNTLSKRYADAKQKIADSCSLNYADENVAAELESSLKQIITGFLPANTNKSESEHRSSTVQAIKQQAMTQAVNTMKHLTGVNERKKRMNMKRNRDSKSESKSPDKPSSTGSPSKTNVTDKSEPKAKIHRKTAKNMKDLQTDIYNESAKASEADSDSNIVNSDNSNVILQSLPVLTQKDDEHSGIQIVEDVDQAVANKSGSVIEGPDPTSSVVRKGNNQDGRQRVTRLKTSGKKANETTRKTSQKRKCENHKVKNFLQKSKADELS